MQAVNYFVSVIIFCVGDTGHRGNIITETVDSRLQTADGDKMQTVCEMWAADQRY